MTEYGTEGGNRTRTVLPPPDFESGASTSFATSAYHKDEHYNKGFCLCKLFLGVMEEELLIILPLHLNELIFLILFM